MIKTPGRPKLVRSGRHGQPKKLYITRIGTSAVSDNEVESNVDADELQDDIFEYTGILSIGDALKSDERKKLHLSRIINKIRKDAIYSETKSLVKNDTFEIIKRSNDDNLIDNRFVLTNKLGANYEIVKRKARLVAKGYNKKYRALIIKSIFAVARLQTIRYAHLELNLKIHIRLISQQRI